MMYRHGYSASAWIPPAGSTSTGLTFMGLAFALMAGINGLTGSCATLSHGLFRTKLRRRQLGGKRILTLHG
jgi:hypothetical protein